MLATIGILSSSYKASGGFSRSITFDQPASDLSNFPVLFTGTYTYLKTVANGGKVENANGYDITFYSDSGLTSPLDFERVFWSATTGDVEFWIRIPTLTSASATVIYISYGRTSITSDQQDAEGVWNTEYKGVWHLKDGTTLSLLDSTSNNNDGTNNGAVVGAGQIDGAAEFAGAEYVTVGDMTSIEGGSELTVSCWVRPSPILAARGFVVKRNSDETQDCFFMAARSGSASNLMVGVGLGVDESAITEVGGLLATDTWTYCTMVFNGALSGDSNRLKLFTNGTQRTLTFSSVGIVPATVPATTAVTTFAAHSDLAFFFIGRMDEIRIATSAKTDTWIATEYSNQNDPANFYTIGSET